MKVRRKKPLTTWQRTKAELVELRLANEKLRAANLDTGRERELRERVKDLEFARDHALNQLNHFKTDIASAKAEIEKLKGKVFLGRQAVKTLRALLSSYDAVLTHDERAFMFDPVQLVLPTIQPLSCKGGCGSFKEVVYDTDPISPSGGKT